MRRTAIRVVLLVCVIITNCAIVFSQGGGSDNPVVVGLHGYYGSIIPHARAIEPISHTNPRGFEVNLALHLTSESIWQYLFSYPRVGAAFHYIDFGNRDIVGSAIAVYPYVEPFIRAHRRFSMAIRFGSGFSYQTTVYNEDTNPDNEFFGSHIAFIVMMGASANYSISDNIVGRLSFNYNHISNGGTVKPNYGINYPLLGIGVDYLFRPYDFEKREKDRSVILNPRKNRFDASLFISGRESEHYGRWYGVYGAWAGYSRMVGRVSAIYGGAELVSDHLVKEDVNRDFINGVIDERTDHLRFSILAGHELVLGRFIFSQYAGVYLYSPVSARDPWYQRYALLFRFAPSTWIGINAKSHKQVIDFIDLRLVRSF